MIKQQQLRDHMVVAKNLIAKGEKCLMQAAEVIAEVSQQGASQRQIAAEIGKSQAWVCRLLAWRAAGYADETPFGPESKAKRDRARDQAPDQPDTDQSADQAEADQGEEKDDADEAETESDEGDHDQAPDDGDDEAETMRQEFKRARRAKAAGDRSMQAKRILLAKALGMLGSNHDGEVISAARLAEKLRTDIGLTWLELIVGDISGFADAA
jgi:hypothetical protein